MAGPGGRLWRETLPNSQVSQMVYRPGQPWSGRVREMGRESLTLVVSKEGLGVEIKASD